MAQKLNADLRLNADMTSHDCLLLAWLIRPADKYGMGVHDVLVVGIFPFAPCGPLRENHIFSRLHFICVEFL